MKLGHISIRINSFKHFSIYRETYKFSHINTSKASRDTNIQFDVKHHLSCTKKQYMKKYDEQYIKQLMSELPTNIAPEVELKLNEDEGPASNKVIKHLQKLAIGMKQFSTY